MWDYLYTDVLIVGAGLAGIMAAIAAADEGSEVVLTTGGNFLKAGSSYIALQKSSGWGIQVALGQREYDTVENHFLETLEVGLGVCNENLVSILVEEAPLMVKRLISWGIPFKKEGTLLKQITGCFSRMPRAVITGNSYEVLPIIEKQIRKRKIKIIENFSITDLIIHEGRCWGAVGLIQRKRFLEIHSKTTILATGGAGAIFSRNMVDFGSIGWSYALGAMAGAKLINLEFIQIMLGVTSPEKKENFPLDWLQYEPVFLDANGHDILSDSWITAPIDKIYSERSKHYPFSTRDESAFLDIAVASHIQAQKGVAEDGILVKFPPIKQEQISLPNPVQVAPYSHAFNGGLLIDAQCRTSVEGLYAAGECAGGIHGADRIGGNMQAACVVFGFRAGKFAAKEALSMKALSMKNVRHLTRHEDIKKTWNNRSDKKLPILS